MTKHIHLCLWALIVLWQLKTIKKHNRLRLWTKTLRLYCCFLGFVDNYRPKDQLCGAMISALISAVYDYDTDWNKTQSYKHSNLRILLEKYVQCSAARQDAQVLFETDLSNSLSNDGLERGSVALVFYHSLIRSNWLNKYTHEDIIQFGRSLQIVDDLLDFENDQSEKQQNCFLSPEKRLFIGEAKVFLEGDFFKKLIESSIVYRILKIKCKEQLNKLQDIEPTTNDLITSIRPRTGFFAGGLVIAGFNLQSTPIILLILTVVSFISVTWSIMVSNDLMDRYNDLRKKKRLASDHTYVLIKFWLKISMPTLMLISWLITINYQVGVFCIGVWIVGILYSCTRLIFPLNNIVVAICSASPILCGMIYTKHFELGWVVIFFVISTLIFMREILKDIEDYKTDKGYKRTAPVLFGQTKSVLLLIMLCCIATILLLVHSSIIIVASIFLLVPVYIQSLKLLKHSGSYKDPMRSIDRFLTILIIVLVITT